MMFHTNSFTEFRDRFGDDAREVKCIMHTSILKDLLKKFTIQYIARVELVAIHVRDVEVYVRVVLRDMSYIAKYSYQSFMMHWAPPKIDVTPVIIPPTFRFTDMSFLHDGCGDTLTVHNNYIQKYASICEATPFALLYKNGMYE